MKKDNLKIAILGYGSMGKEVEKAALLKNITVTDIFDIDKPINPNADYKFDVAIDFTLPESVIGNVEILSKMGKNIVIGTTGWEKHKMDIESMTANCSIGTVYASNFSIGMQMFFRIVDQASRMKNLFPEYDIFMHEIHHKRKKDSPSGTALTLAQSILKNVDSKNEIYTNKCEGEIQPDQLHVSSNRGGEIAGTHTIFIDSAADTLELTHRAKNRTGFAMGALQAAEWINGKKGFFDFKDVFDEIINS